MTQGHKENPSILSSVESEMTPATSPLLQYLISHAKSIILLLIGFIVLLIAYWGYENRQASIEQDFSNQASAIALSNLNAEEQLAALQELRSKAPSNVHMNINALIVALAKKTNNLSVAFSAWQDIEKIAPDFSPEPTLAQAAILVKEGKINEAIDLIIAKQAAISDLATNPQKRITFYALGVKLADYAEMAGKIDIAIESYTHLLENSKDDQETSRVWRQKLSYLQNKKASTSN